MAIGKLISRAYKPNNTIIKIGDVVYGDGSFNTIAGPCAVESLDQLMSIGISVKKGGAHLLRGGAFKPRTSPYSFQGLGEQGLKFLSIVSDETGLPIVTEAMDTETFDLVEQYADVIQIGTRNMQNFALLKRAGKSNKPIMLKRGMSATLSEWLLAAEYIMQEGNKNIILCERGIRTFTDHSRNTMDLSVIDAVKKETHLPIITDPSHAAGVTSQIISLSYASAAVNADGIMVEVHNHPDIALCDGKQALYPEQFASMMTKVNKIHFILKN